MSHQSGIKPSPQMMELWNKNKNSSSIRAVKVTIQNEQMGYTRTCDAVKSWDKDLSSVQPWFDSKNACYILFRHDSTFSNGDFQWMLLIYIPDNAKVRDKMLYASSRATLLRELGEQRFVDTLFGTAPSEFSHEGYLEHRKHQDAQAPLTRAEQTRAEMTGSGDEISGTTTRRTHSNGLSFRISAGLTHELKRFFMKEVSLLTMLIDIPNEVIDIAFSDSKGTLKTLVAEVPNKTPTYILYRFVHEFKGKKWQPTYFVYCCPTASGLREKMIYSSTKNALTDAIESLGIDLTRKCEIDDPLELTEEFFFNDIHNSVDAAEPKVTAALAAASSAAGGSAPAPAPPAPVTLSQATTFNKPSRPGRGPAKLTATGSVEILGEGEKNEKSEKSEKTEETKA